MYKVEYADGYKTKMVANEIANNLLSQVDQDRQCFVLFDKVIDHRTNGMAIKEEETFIYM